jgi:hypothetical protein
MPLGNCERLLFSAGNRARDGTPILPRQFERIEPQHQGLVRKMSRAALGTLRLALVTLALLLGGAIWLSMYYADIICGNQISADLLKAYNQADVMLCDGRLCAKIGKKYLPVAPR